MYLLLVKKQHKKEDEEDKEISYTNVKISDFVNTKVGYKRADTLYDYLKKIDKDFTLINDHYSDDLLKGSMRSGVPAARNTWART